MRGGFSRGWQTFRRNTPAFVSLILFAVLFATSLFSELIANDRPLFIQHQGRTYFPIFRDYTEEDFGGDLPLPVDYRDPLVMEAVNEEGMVIWPPVRFSFETINFDRVGTFPLPPGEGNYLGTDDQGRDIVARLLYGFRLSILFGFALAAFSSVVGIVAGTLQGYLGGKVDLFGQRFMEVWSGVPVLYLIIIISASLRMSFWLLLLVMLLFGWMRLVSVVRRECLRVRNLEYVTAARALGVTDARIMFRHVLPNALVAVFSVLPFVVNGSIVALTSLDFLGFGLPPGYPSLGEMIAQGKNNLFAPWIGISIFVLMTLLLSMLVLIGEGVRDAFDPSVYLSGDVGDEAEDDGLEADGWDEETRKEDMRKEDMRKEDTRDEAGRDREVLEDGALDGMPGGGQADKVSRTAGQPATGRGTPAAGARGPFQGEGA